MASPWRPIIALSRIHSRRHEVGPGTWRPMTDVSRRRTTDERPTNDSDRREITRRHSVLQEQRWLAALARRWSRKATQRAVELGTPADCFVVPGAMMMNGERRTGERTHGSWGLRIGGSSDTDSQATTLAPVRPRLYALCIFCFVKAPPSAPNSQQPSAISHDQIKAGVSAPQIASIFPILSGPGGPGSAPPCPFFPRCFSRAGEATGRPGAGTDQAESDKR